MDFDDQVVVEDITSSRGALSSEFYKTRLEDALAHHDVLRHLHKLQGQYRHFNVLNMNPEFWDSDPSPLKPALGGQSSACGALKTAKTGHGFRQHRVSKLQKSGQVLAGASGGLFTVGPDLFNGNARLHALERAGLDPQGPLAFVRLCFFSLSPSSKPYLHAFITFFGRTEPCHSANPNVFLIG
ncbi:hypothetical protein BDN72DRAFT_895235 [Pluteus cervinus]|uniref:Uncharacterized protein n=1 Tax=Pluteus cervinus TaxID=181527 RepID=A0ACD3B1T6_9AGAR|nr:hypothetical protein BDN72DRAFT_895235 [Pluteus cervinus]